MRMAMRIAVIGTGTGVGKTHASVALLLALGQQGARASGLKPIESGVGDGPTDFGDLARASSVAPQPPPYTFTDPVSPHLAARRENRLIALDPIRAWVDQHQADWLVIETAGGLLSPLGPELANIDLVRALSPQALLLVAPDRLGVLHDVRACVIALGALFPNHPPILCLLQAPPSPDASTGTNGDELRSLGIAPSVVSFPRARPTDPETLSAATAAIRLLAHG